MTVGASRAELTITRQPALAPSPQPRPAPTAQALPLKHAVPRGQNWTPIGGQIWKPIDTPELNPQENIWQFMRQNWLSNRIFKSFDDIVDHCCYAWNTLIDQPWKIMSIAYRDWALVGQSI